MTRTTLVVIGVAGALALAVGAAGCDPKLRAKVLGGLGRVLAQPDLPTLVREVAGVLLSDEWRERLDEMKRTHGVVRMRVAVKAIRDRPSIEGDVTVRGGALDGRTYSLAVSRDRERTRKTRAAAWLAENPER